MSEVEAVPDPDDEAHETDTEGEVEAELGKDLFGMLSRRRLQQRERTALEKLRRALEGEAL